MNVLIDALCLQSANKSSHEAKLQLSKKSIMGYPRSHTKGNLSTTVVVNNKHCLICNSSYAIDLKMHLQV